MSMVTTIHMYSQLHLVNYTFKFKHAHSKVQISLPERV